MDRIYCYPGTDILVNKLNIQNHKRLLDAERKLTNLRILDLLENPVKGSFDLTHLQAIHRYIPPKVPEGVRTGWIPALWQMRSGTFVDGKYPSHQEAYVPLPW